MSAFDKSPKQSNQISSFFNKEEIPNEQKKYPFIIFNDSKNNARAKKKSITNILSPKNNSVKDFSISNQVSQTPNNLQFSQSQTQFSMFPKSSTNNNKQYINFTQHYRESQSFYKANQTSQVNKSEQMKTLQRSKSIEHISNSNQQFDNQQLLTSKEQIQKEFKQFQLQREKQNQINNLSKNVNLQKMLSQQQCLTISDQISNPETSKSANEQFPFYASNPINKNKYGENYTQFDTYRSLQQSQSPFINQENQNKNVDVSISKFNSQTGKHSEIHFPPQSQEHMMILSNPKSLQNYYYNNKNQIQQALSETLTQQSNTVNTYQSEENSFEINKDQIVQKKPKKQTQFDLQGNQVFEHDPNTIPKQKKTQGQLNQIKIQSLMKKKKSYPSIKVEKSENQLTTQEQLKESRYQTQIKDDIDNLDNQIAKLQAEMIVIDKPDTNQEQNQKLNQLLQQQLNKQQKNEVDIKKQNLEGSLKSPTRKQETFNLINVKQQSAKNLQQQQLKAEKQINLPSNNKQFLNQNQKKNFIKQSISVNNVKKNNLKSNINNFQKKSQATPIKLRQIKNSNVFYSPETKKNSKTVQSLKQKKISFYDQTNFERQNQTQQQKNQNYQRKNFSTSPTPLNQRKQNVYEQSQPMASKSQATQQNKNVFHKKNKTQKSAQFIKQLDKNENDYTFQYNLNNKQHPQTQTKDCKNNDILELQKSQEFKANLQNEEINALEFELLEKQINQQTQKELQNKKQNLAPLAQFNLYAKKSMEIFRSTSPQVKPNHRKINSQIPYSNQDQYREANLNNPYNNQENKIKYHSNAQKNNQQKEISNKNIKNVTQTLKLPQKQKHGGYLDVQNSPNLFIDPKIKQNGINSERYGDKGKLNFQKQQQQQRYNTSLNSSFRQKKQNTNDELSPTNPSQFLKIIQKRNQQQKQQKQSKT
ncbi:hypothetical protein PPERSA_01468 [Pseudocohnilembus persalinus]|uniref:Uncharacterized protein n=1 Tax=Pseudocohnilembus persalinus TaxID=266149 RepID=A0A0V0QH55_PSEPJ|nr:hypothetical protein PPERSA_01468 [Pseudocohnilembus persalinus]|eukprot:KRX01565.1 hypothetical protein PPERSA_01468 [Pseudocohnilembus persalinus]